MAHDLSQLTTEGRSAYTELDTVSVPEILAAMNDEDERVSRAVRAEIPRIAKAVEAVVRSLASGGRLLYIGAGTSGRLGVLDASECPPTFGVPEGLVQGVIAGGDRSLRFPSEDAEDDEEGGTLDLQARGLTSQDAVVAIAASGRTPYCIGALREARRVGARTVALVCNAGSAMEALAEITICPLVGPEVIMGSTRLKAGTAQKMVLNMLSTAAMVRLGKTYSNLMVDLRATNVKLRARAEHVVVLATGCEVGQAVATLERAGYEAKPAIVMVLMGCSADEARTRLSAAGGFVRLALREG
jgi:N-acetylmuramic acid 6-phosphate etherase